MGPQRSTYPVNHSLKETAKRECKDLTEKIIGRGHRAYSKMGFGFLESVYEKCLLIALRKDAARTQQHKPMIVCYEGEIVGPFVAGIGVEDTLILPLKSVKRRGRGPRDSAGELPGSDRQARGFGSRFR